MANGQSAADFIAKRRAQAGKTARRRTGGRRTGGGGTGGGGTGGGGEAGGQSTAKKQVPVDNELLRTKRKAAAGLIATGKAKLDPRERDLTSETGEEDEPVETLLDQPLDRVVDIQAGLETSPTEMGLRETRAFENQSLADMIVRAQQNVDSLAKDAERARLNLEEAELARGRAKFGGTAKRDPETGRLVGYREAGFGILPGARDPETLRLADSYNRRYGDNIVAQGQLKGAQEQLNFLQRAMDKGADVAEIRQRLFDELRDQEVERDQMQSDLELKYRAERGEFGGLGGGTSIQMQGSKDDPVYIPTGGAFRKRLDDLNARRDFTIGMLDALPETEEFQFEVEPLSESPQEVMDEPGFSRGDMSDEDFLASMMSSPVSPDEPAGRNPNAVTRPIDPVMVGSMQRELGKDTASRSVSDLIDTGR